MIQALEELKAEFDSLNANELSDVDLRTFISYLMLCDPTITQAQIAKILGITPVALSRHLNSESADFKFKREWSKKLLNAFNYIDIRKARDNWNNLLHLVNHIESRQEYLALADLMACHLDIHAKGYCFNPKSYSISHDHILFERGSETWIFFIQSQKVFVASHAPRLWQYPRSVELQRATHFSIICQSKQMYTCYTSSRFLPNNLSAWKENFKTISVLLVSQDEDFVERETILYDSEKGIDFPENN